MVGVINLFCLVVLLSDKKFRTLDFVAIMIGCAVDVVSAGIMGTYQNLLLALAYLVPPCMFKWRQMFDLYLESRGVEQVPYYLLELVFKSTRVAKSHIDVSSSDLGFTSHGYLLTSRVEVSDFI